MAGQERTCAPFLLVSDLQDRVLLTQGSARWLLQVLVFTYPLVASLVVQAERVLALPAPALRATG